MLCRANKLPPVDSPTDRFHEAFDPLLVNLEPASLLVSLLRFVLFACLFYTRQAPEADTQEPCRPADEENLTSVSSSSRRVASSRSKRIRSFTKRGRGGRGRTRTGEWGKTPERTQPHGDAMAGGGGRGGVRAVGRCYTAGRVE